MWMSHEVGLGAFAELRQGLLDALEHTEQQAREQAAEIVRQAEERARHTTEEAERRAAEAEERLASLRTQTEEARASLAAIKERLGGILRAVDDVDADGGEANGRAITTPVSRPSWPTQGRRHTAESPSSNGHAAPRSGEFAASSEADSGAEEVAAEEAESGQEPDSGAESASLLALRGGLRPWRR